MTAFYVALVIGAITTLAYVALAGRAFWRVRTELLADGPAPANTESDETYVGQGRLFGWKAVGGVVASTLVLVAISATPTAWYLLPFLTIGSAIAVIVAFIVDRPS